jgi:serine protease Do
MPSPNTPSFFSRLRANRLASAFTLLTTLTIGVLAGAILTRDVGAKEQHVDTSDARPLVIPDPVKLSNGFSSFVKQVGPAVVNINTQTIPKKAAAPKGRRAIPRGGQAQPGDPDQGDMQDFFNRFFGGQNGGGDDDSDGGPGGERQALGSGFIVDPHGYIITNNHVIGVDPETDIAVIKIDVKEPLPTIKLGNSDGAQVGDWVLAIGSPFGLNQTVSAGIVSAKDRGLPDDRDANGISKSFQRFIQTDAAINPGNSGGPLVDMTGAVVGMNTAIYTQSMGSQGVGFAMPSNVISKVYNDLISPEHKVIRGSIGIQFQAETSSAVSRVYGFAKGGVTVSIVTPNGGAAKAGIKPRDILVTIDGRQIKDGDDLVADISSRKVGSSVQVGFLRDGKAMTATVTIGDRAKVYEDLGPQPAEVDVAPAPDAGQSKLGITVTAIPPAVATKLGIEGGVAVNSVTPGSFADDIGLSKGALITEINRQPVTDEASYRAIVAKLKPGDDVAFVIKNRNDKGVTFVGGTLR